VLEREEGERAGKCTWRNNGQKLPKLMKNINRWSQDAQQTHVGYT
jgi:hypothetical protein